MTVEPKGEQWHDLFVRRMLVVRDDRLRARGSTDRVQSDLYGPAGGIRIVLNGIVLKTFGRVSLIIWVLPMSV